MRIVAAQLYVKLSNASWKREEGQTMAEYAIILAVIVVAVLATLALLAGGINRTLSSVTSKL